MRGANWAAVAILCVAVWAAAQSPYQQAAAHLKNGQPAAAVALLEPLVGQAPRDVKALTLLGMALAAAGRTEDAAVRLQQALAVDPRFTPALQNLGLAELAAGRTAAAKRHFVELLKLTPQDPMAHLGLAQIAYASADYPSSVRHYQRSRELYLNDPQHLLRYAAASAELNDSARAAELLRRLPDAVPAAVHFDAGVLWARLGDYAAAVPRFEKARSGFDPYRAGFNLALAYFKNGQAADAAKIAEELIAAGHRTAEIHNLLGLACDKAGRTREAYEALRTATRIDPSDETNYLDLVALCIRHGNLDLAREIAEIGVARLPRSSRLHLQRGVVFAVKGDFPHAREAFEATRALAPATGLAHVALGLVLMQMDRAPEAVEALRGRLRESPDDYLALWFLGEALYRAGAHPASSGEAEAVRALSRSVELKPDLPDARVLLGKLLLRRGELDRAAAHLEQALKLEPGNVGAMYPLAQVYSKKGDAERARVLFAKVGKARQEERERFAQSGLAQIVREGSR
jgi:tetratricopeptide (TPR) repeat protein